MLGACELLRMAAAILSYEDPRGTLAEGPVLDIVRNVALALENCKPATYIGSPETRRPIAFNSAGRPHAAPSACLSKNGPSPKPKYQMHQPAMR